jgi:hypothetical protein
MAVSVEMHHTGDAGLQRDVMAMIEHVLSDRLGNWRVLIVGSQGSDRVGDEDYGSQRVRALVYARGRVRGSMSRA